MEMGCPQGARVEPGEELAGCRDSAIGWVEIKGCVPRVAETGERRCGRKSYDRDWVDRTSLRWQERKGRREIKIITGLRRGERDKDCPCGG